MEIVAQIALAGLLIILVTFVAVVAWCVFEVLHEQFIEWRQRALTLDRGHGVVSVMPLPRG